MVVDIPHNYPALLNLYDMEMPIQNVHITIQNVLFLAKFDHIYSQKASFANRYKISTRS